MSRFTRPWTRCRPVPGQPTEAPLELAPRPRPPDVTQTSDERLALIGADAAVHIAEIQRDRDVAIEKERTKRAVVRWVAWPLASTLALGIAGAVKFGLPFT